MKKSFLNLLHVIVLSIIFISPGYTQNYDSKGRLNGHVNVKFSKNFFRGSDQILHQIQGTQLHN